MAPSGSGWGYGAVWYDMVRRGVVPCDRPVLLGSQAELISSSKARSIQVWEKESVTRDEICSEGVPQDLVV